MYLNSNDRTSISIQKWFQLWEKDSHPSIYCSNIICSRINTFIQIVSYLIQLLMSLFLTQYSQLFSTNCHLFKVNSNTWRLARAYHYFSPFKTLIFFYTLHTMLNICIFLTFVCWWPKLGCCVVFEQPCWKSTLKIYVQ